MRHIWGKTQMYVVLMLAAAATLLGSGPDLTTMLGLH